MPRTFCHGKGVTRIFLFSFHHTIHIYYHIFERSSSILNKKLKIFLKDFLNIIFRKKVAVFCFLLYNNITRLTKINFCIAFAICFLLNANNSRLLKYGVKKSLQANFFTYIMKCNFVYDFGGKSKDAFSIGRS